MHGGGQHGVGGAPMGRRRGRRSRAAEGRPVSTSAAVEAPDSGWRSLRRTETDPDGAEWVVRPVSGAAATKTYRCPGCDQLIAAGTPHVVAWSTDVPLFGGLAGEDRRHWHRPCWQARGRRAPGRRPPPPYVP